jgi:hypothetical protein
MMSRNWLPVAVGLAGLCLGWRMSVPTARPEPLSAAEVVERMVAMNAARTQALHAYSATRVYHIEYSGLGRHTADMTVRMNYQEPGPKRFTITSEAGSGMLRHHVLEPLVRAEQHDAEMTREHGLAIVPANYHFELLQQPAGEQQRDYILQATPLSDKSRRFLFHGKLWINPDDYGIERIEGELPEVPSFWVTRAEFDYRNQKIGDFWLPQESHTIAHLRWFGRAVLTIRYGGFQFASISPVPPYSAAQPGAQP